MASASEKARRAAQDREALKLRRQKMFIAVGGGVLLVVVGFQLLPSLFGGSGSSSPPKSTTPPAAATANPASHSIRTASPPSALPRSVERLEPRDLFMPQIVVSAGGSGGSGTPAGKTLTGPPVRARRFVAKDPFVPQITPPAATPATSSLTQTPTGEGSGSGRSQVSGGAGYIVVLTTIPGTGLASEKAAARAVVAAKNAGLRDVVANDAVPGASGSAPHFTVYTGPYEFESSAQSELVRALRNGYPKARAQALPSSSGRGF
jgi:hypothetical protein